MEILIFYIIAVDLFIWQSTTNLNWYFFLVTFYFKVSLLHMLHVHIIIITINYA